MAGVVQDVAESPREDLPHDPTIHAQDPEVETATEIEADPEAQQQLIIHALQRQQIPNQPPILLQRNQDIIKTVLVTNGLNSNTNDQGEQQFQQLTIKHSPTPHKK